MGGLVLSGFTVMRCALFEQEITRHVVQCSGFNTVGVKSEGVSVVLQLSPERNDLLCRFQHSLHFVELWVSWLAHLCDFDDSFASHQASLV